MAAAAVRVSETDGKHIVPDTDSPITQRAANHAKLLLADYSTAFAAARAAAMTASMS